MKVFAVVLVCVVAMATVEGLHLGPFMGPHLLPGLFPRVQLFPRPWVPMIGHGIGGIFPRPGFGAYAEPGFGALAEPGVGVAEPAAVPEYY